MRLFWRREQHEFNALVADDVGVVTGRDLEKVPWSNVRLDAGRDHANHETASDAVAGMGWCRRPSCTMAIRPFGFMSST